MMTLEVIGMLTQLGRTFEVLFINCDFVFYKVQEEVLSPTPSLNVCSIIISKKMFLFIMYRLESKGVKPLSKPEEESVNKSN